MNNIEAYIAKSKEWLIKANNDLRSAEILMRDPDPPTDTICYHCQQALEKYLKGFLTRHQIEFIKTHDLDYLFKLCLKIDKNFNDYQDDILSVNKYAIETRYPADLPIFYSVKEAKLTLETTKEIIKFISSKL